MNYKNIRSKIMVKTKLAGPHPGAPEGSQVTAEFLADTTGRAVGDAILGIAARILDVKDDAGLDWFTHNGTDVYIGGAEWKVGSDPYAAALVDAASILIYGEIMELDAEEILEAQARGTQEVFVRAKTG